MSKKFGFKALAMFASLGMTGVLVVGCNPAEETPKPTPITPPAVNKPKTEEKKPGPPAAAPGPKTEEKKTPTPAPTPAPTPEPKKEEPAKKK